MPRRSPGPVGGCNGLMPPPFVFPEYIPFDAILLESGEAILLEDGDWLLLE